MKKNRGYSTNLGKALRRLPFTYSGVTNTIQKSQVNSHSAQKPVLNLTQFKACGTYHR